MQDHKVVLSPTDAELLESPDGMMRDSILVTDDSCGAGSVSAGIVWVHPKGRIHEDTHAFDEVYYVVRGSAEVVMDGQPHAASPGNVVFIPAGVRHYVENANDDVFEIFWLISAKWSDLPAIHEELGKWPRVSTTDGWHLTS